MRRFIGCGIACLLAGAASAAPPEHVVIVVEENHSYTQVIGSADAPFLNSLAHEGALLTSCYALTHPSQPNYLQLFSGAPQGIVDDTVPAPGAPFATPNLAASLRAAGRTFAGFCEGLPAVGSTVTSAGQYVRRHNPWVNWQVPAPAPGSNQLPPDVNRPFTDFPTDFTQLPHVSVVVPNLLDDMHDGTVAQADAWLQANLGAYVQWCRAHDTLLIVTWDEDESASRNRIPTILFGPLVVPGPGPATWTLHNLLRTVGDMYGATPAGASADVAPLTGVFRSDHLVATRRFGRTTQGTGATHDTYLEQAAPDASHAAGVQIVVDGSPVSQGLVRFESVFGAGAEQVPPGAVIVSAKLLLLTGSSSTGGDSSASTMRVHRMLRAWDDGATWNSMTGGISPDGVEAAAQGEFALVPNVLTAWGIFDVTASARAWAADPASNHGWAILPGGSDGWRPRSAETADASDAPILEITFDLGPPCPGDWDRSGSVTSSDFFLFVAAFFTGMADFNADGATGSQDFFDFLTAFFTPCR